MNIGPLLAVLKARFEQHPHRHDKHTWARVLARLEQHPSALQTLARMQATAGEPDVIGFDEASQRYCFCDCAPESPLGRRSLCFDEAALHARKENKPSGSAVGMAQEIGCELLTEADYRQLQLLGEFDVKTSSWVATPAPIRALGGALFCDRRYGQVFTYHNGVQSYYASRGFRGRLMV